MGSLEGARRLSAERWEITEGSGDRREGRQGLPLRSPKRLRQTDAVKAAWEVCKEKLQTPRQAMSLISLDLPLCQVLGSWLGPRGSKRWLGGKQRRQEGAQAPSAFAGSLP